MAILGSTEQFSIQMDPVTATGPFVVSWSISPLSSNVIITPSIISTFVQFNSLGTFTLSVTISGQCGTEKSYERIIVVEEGNNCSPISISNPLC